MFGRVRPSSCSTDSMERPPSKIIKDDSLSIYETTLKKLKLGSQREPTRPNSEEELLKIQRGSVEETVSGLPSLPNNESAMMDADSSSSGSPNSIDIDSQCKDGLNSQGKSNLSVMYMFSKYEMTRRGR